VWIVALLLLLSSLGLFVMKLPYFTLLGGIGLFLIAAIFPVKDNTYTGNMRVISMCLYYVHMYIIFVCLEICKFFEKSIHTVILLAITSVSAFALSYFMILLQKKSKNKWLDLLIK
jgi:hypothetical protein